MIWVYVVSTIICILPAIALMVAHVITGKVDGQGMLIASIMGASGFIPILGTMMAVFIVLALISFSLGFTIDDFE